MIRIFNTATGDQVQEVRRGVGKADIRQIIFHPTSDFMACTSEKKSVHIYELIKANSQIDYDTIDASIIASTGCSASSEYEIIYFQSIIEKKSNIHHCYPENTSEVNQFH